ncbi:MAG: isoprenylcysteine carboxylmethyltransferase family protein, partial [Lentisphaerae bacterium]|nr:isoprenylcysteine carboxylmethyltransferase family protein [Lentisphaerota bacterium]
MDPAENETTGDALTAVGEARGIMPPTYLLIAVITEGFLHLVAPVFRLLFLPYGLVGILPIALGIGINVRCSGLFGKAGTTIKPFQESRELVTDGPYRFSRHPMYLGMALILTGQGLLLGSLSPFLVVIAFAWIFTKRFIVPEEKEMEARFGPRYV